MLGLGVVDGVLAHGYIQRMRECLGAAMDARFPIGKMGMPKEVTSVRRKAAIEEIAATPARLRAAVSGLSDSQLDTPYREGGWTVRQVVHHIADSHANCYIRFKLAVTEDWPTIKPYDEAAWAKLADSQLPVEVSIAWIEALHRRWVALLESM